MTVFVNVSNLLKQADQPRRSSLDWKRWHENTNLGLMIQKVGLTLRLHSHPTIAIASLELSTLRISLEMRAATKRINVSKSAFDAALGLGEAWCAVTNAVHYHQSNDDCFIHDN